MRYLIFIITFVVSAAAGNMASHLAFEDLYRPHVKKDAPFNHRKHTALSECGGCHKYQNDGTFTGIPDAENCLKCHNEFASQNIFADSNKPWESYAKQKANIYCSHKVVLSARFNDGRKKTDCLFCHGNKADSWDTSMIIEKLSMDQCLNCHEALNISRKCMVCH